MRLLNVFEPEDLSPKHYRLKVHDISEERFKVDSQEFEFIKLLHVNGHGIRFRSGKNLCALSGDSGFDKPLIDFIRGADFAVIDSGHITDDDIIELAVEAKPKRMICSHQYRSLGQDKLNDGARKRGFEGEIIVGSDLDSFELL